MSKVRIRKVTIEAFRSFVDKQSTSTLPTKGLVGIRGKNNDTSGSSGAGKSSVAYAICYALGIAPYSATKLQSKWTKTPMQVELELETPEGIAILKRGKITSIKVGDEPEISGSVAEVEKRLQRLVGLSPEMLKALTFRQQKKPGLFLSMKDSQKKEFLSGLLGLQEVEKRIEEAVPLSTKHKTEAEKLETVKKALEAQVRVPVEPVYEGDMLHDIANKLKIAQGFVVAALEAKEASEKRLKTLTDELENERQLILTTRDREAKEFNATATERLRNFPQAPVSRESAELVTLEGVRSECTSRIEDAEYNLKGALEHLGLELKAQEEEYKRLNSIIVSQPVVNNKIQELTNKLFNLNNSKCPTCSQTWNPAEGLRVQWEADLEDARNQSEEIYKAEKQCAEIVDEISKIKSKIEAVRASPEIGQLKEMLQNIDIRIATMRAEVKGQHDAHNIKRSMLESEIKAERQALVAKHQNEILTFGKNSQAKLNTLNSEVAMHNLAYNNALSGVESIKYEVARVQQRNQMLKEQYERDKAAYEKLIKDIANVDKQYQEQMEAYKRESDFVLSLRAFMGQIFEEVLVEVATETNNLLKSLANVATTTIEFTTVKNELKPVIRKNGQEIDIEAHLSGGQGTSLELAVDLAIGRVVGRRTGSRPGWLILDESFEGHDMAVKETCLEVLQQAAQDTLILIVDHASELKEYFSAFLDVESTNDVSKFVENV